MRGLPDGTIELSRDSQLDGVENLCAGIEAQVLKLTELDALGELDTLLEYPETVVNLERYRRGVDAAEPFYEDEDATASASGD